MISRPDRVAVFASQLAANDFPPVCASTGAPAETWRKFRFSTPPAWAYWFFLLTCTGAGLLIVFLAIYLVSIRASGHLPLTKASSRVIGFATWIPLGFLIATVALWFFAAIAAASSNDQAVGTVVLLALAISVLTLLCATLGYLVVKPLVGPRGKVFEPQPGYLMVELRNVHPAFVAAVNHMNQQRAAQFAPPPVPRSN